MIILLEYNLFLNAIRLKTQDMCNKAVKTCFFLFDSVPHWYKSQKMCDEAIDDYLTALKFIRDWVVTNKMPEKLHDF